MPNTFNVKPFVWLAALLALAIWFLAQLTTEIRYPFGNDGIGYISEAANILDGRGIVRMPNETELPDLDLSPTRYHPPGFGVTIAALASLGIDVERAALLISHLAWAALPFALFFALQPILPPPWSVAVAALATLSPGMVLFGSSVNADAPTLLVLVLATGLVFRALASERQALRLLAAGVLLGLGYAMRNSVTATYAGLLAALLAAVVLRQVSAPHAARYATLILLGSAPVIGLLFARNLLVFGELQPYVLMVGQHASFLESFRVALDGLLGDLTGSLRLGKALAWDAKLLLIAGLPAAFLVAWGLLRQWRRGSLQVRFAILFGLAFSGASLSMLVIAHTFHGLDFGFLLRHMMQFAWMLLALLVLAALGLAGRPARIALAIVVTVLLGSRLWFIADDLQRERMLQQAFFASPDIAVAAQPLLAGNPVLTSQIRPALARDASLAAAVRALPEGALILSNQGPLLGHVSGRTVRMIPSPDAEGVAAIATRVNNIFRDMRTNRPVYLVLVPDNRLLHSIDQPDWKRMVQAQLPPRFGETGEGVNFLVLRAEPPQDAGEASR